MKKTIKETNDTRKLYSDAFWKGWIATFDPFVLFPELSAPGRGSEHDRDAIAGDWQAVGSDIRKAMGIVVNGG